MRVVEIKSRKEEKEFLQLPIRLYRDVDQWIRPLDKDINDIFDPAKNKSFRNGECVRWLLRDSADKTIGRVAAFYNKRIMMKGNDQPTGGMGFFECIDDYDAANLLFQTCEDWLKEKGMEAMDGPVNFGERDKWWGLLIDGFQHEPNYCIPYNHPYYKDFFERFGFREYFNQLTFARVTKDPLSPRLAEKAEKIAKTPGYSFRHARKKELDNYAEDFRHIYNKAWANHKGVAEMKPAQARSLIYKMKPIMDEKILWFGYYNDEPIAFFIMLPEVNQIFKHVNGKLDLKGKLIFLWYKWRRSVKKMLGVVFGVIPEHQGKGVEGALIMAARQMVQDDYHRYPYLEMNWIGDFNPKMIRVVEQVGGHVAKTHTTFRKLFDPNKEFKRHPFINNMR